MSGPTDGKSRMFASRAEAISLTALLIGAARQEICIYTPRFDRFIFDNTDIVQSLSEFARRNRRTQIRILLADTKQLIQTHRVVALAQKLSSKIYIHLASRDDQHYHQCLLVDTTAYLYCPTAERYAGHAEFDAASAVLQLRHDFDKYWQRSASDPNTRRLYL